MTFCNQFVTRFPQTKTLDTVDLAFLSFYSYDPTASAIGRQRYPSALPLVNAALQSTENATKDTALLAVLLLDLFEKLTKDNPLSIDSWMGM